MDELSIFTLIQETLDQWRKDGRDLKTYIRWNNSSYELWKYEMLMSIGAINDIGPIADYPVMKIEKKDGSAATKDFGGDLPQIEAEVLHFNQNRKDDNWQARIHYYPKTYFDFQREFDRMYIQSVESMTEESRSNAVIKLRKMLSDKHKFIKSL